MLNRSAAIIVAFCCAITPVVAQNVQGGAESTGSAATNQTEKGPAPGQTGAGSRGTEVAPSTTPGQPSQPSTAQTGVEPRGTKVGPSTNPGEGGQQKQ